MSSNSPTEPNRKPTKGPTLGVRLLRLLLGVGVPLLGIIGFFVFDYSRKRIEDIEEEIQQKAIALARAMDVLVDDSIMQLETIRAFISPDDSLDRVRDVAWRTLTPLGRILIVYDAQGRQLINSGFPEGTLLKLSADATHVSAVARKNEPDVSQAYYGANSGNLRMAVRIPWDRNNTRLVLSLSLTNLHVYRAASAAFGRSPAWTWVISDGNGTVIARQPEHERNVGTKLPNSIIVASVGTVGFGWPIGFDGTPVLRGWARTKLGNWMASASVPAAIVLGPLHRAWALFALAAFLLIGGAVLLAYVQSRSLQEHVATVSDDARAVGHGITIAPRRVGVAELQDIHDSLVAASNELAAARHRSELLLIEVQNRSKKLLAAALSMVQRTLRGEPAVAHVRRELTDRLHALAIVTEVLSDADWQGATLRAVVERTMVATGGEYTVEGGDLMLSAQWATNLALALHELASNAAKYGALSQPGGLVAIRSHREGDWLIFEWEEHGGPPVKPPERTGFGIQLLMALGFDPDRPPVMEFRPEGLIYRLATPYAVAAVDETRTGPDEEPGRSAS